tara:strand:- start:276 stop:491 length:216 start_codon:yes stop_codon:yes gene_type:complete
MERWLSLRGKKETRTCFSCGSSKMTAQFYDWYSHPALTSILGNNLNGIICSNCARREAGSKNWKEIKDGKR